jgi:tetratricopeptide (TPR) repeat protein
MSYEPASEEEPFTAEQEASLRQLAVERAPAELAQLEAAASESDQFVHLPGAAMAAFHLERFAEAKELAERALALAPSFRKNWNYGNAIHFGHTVLGLVALAEDNPALAVAELRKSGDTPGSPQLNSFGPTMQLAKALLRQGQADAVLAYLQQCRKFWDSGGTWLDLWEKKIMEGQVPNCFQHSYR